MRPTAEEVRSLVVYDPDTGFFSKNGQAVGTISSAKRKIRYWRISISSRQYLGHRLAWLYMTGDWPTQIDHINGNGLDNRFSNLRIATDSQNRVNSPAYKHSRTKQRGIHIHACGRYRVQLQKDGRQIHVGYFTNLDDAIVARNDAYRRVHGEFARIDSL